MQSHKKYLMGQWDSFFAILYIFKKFFFTISIKNSGHLSHNPEKPLFFLGFLDFRRWSKGGPMGQIFVPFCTFSDFC